MYGSTTYTIALYLRDILPQNGNGEKVAAGAATSAAVPSANDIDIDMEEAESQPNGYAS